MKNSLIDIVNWASEQHELTNHTYDGRPYSWHLGMVAEVAYKYLHLIDSEHHQVVQAGCWTHDLIEDCRLTYNDVSDYCGEEVAEIAFALTNEKGRNRKERANDKYYMGIRYNHLAWFVKICDRIANIKHSASKNTRMKDMYKKEMQSFYDHLYHPDFKEMFNEMEELLK